MRLSIIILNFVFFISLSAYAQSKNPQFIYEYEARVGSGFNLELYQLSQHFEDQNYNKMSSFSSGDISYMHVDEVLTSTDNNGLIFIKMGLLAPENMQYKIIPMKSQDSSYFLYHTQNASIALFNLNEYQVKKIVRNLVKDNAVVKTFNQLFISKAYADQVECHVQPDQSYQSLENISGALESSVLAKKIGECVVNAFKGAKGQVEDTAEFFKKLLTNPTALWDVVKKSYDEIKVFVSNFKEEIQSFYKTISGLSMDEKLSIACTLAGQAGTGMLMSATGAGAVMGGAKIISSIIPKLTRMKNLMQKLQQYKLPLKTAQETLSCAI